MTELEKAARQALEALDSDDPSIELRAAVTLRQAIEQAEKQEPVAWMYESVCGNNFTTCNKPPGYAKNIRPLYTTPPAAPVQELVAWVDLVTAADAIVKKKFVYKKFIDGTPLANDIPCWMAEFAQQYTTPPAAQREWVGLTDEEILDMWPSETRIEFVRAIEAKLKEKTHEHWNKARQAIEQAPAAPVQEHGLKDVRCECCGYLTHQREHMGCIRAAYAEQRKWVGLTDEEINEAERLANIRHQKHRYSIRGQQITPADDPQWHYARAIEAKLKEKNT